ncbi:ATP-binding protein [Spongiactinospora sp. TRM90649]|uniref:ATP-binding protein n=1 Tax=Spongiactinospora sp. TRM90649 TaxID=3031114 RepID=UPI0023F69632|nr:ATP-binding protein [Spongiactinospora sp. TRM90649]MDF5759208.1 ATP-binding protein [Spongiactinospora sp. TRM90649]
MAVRGMCVIGDMRFPGRTDIMSDVRIYVAQWLVIANPESAENGDLLYDVRLLVTELAGNAVKHTVSGRWRYGSFRVRMWLGTRRVRVEVTDQGALTRPRLRAAPTGSGGRGLRIVDATAVQWGVARRGVGRGVWFELPVRAPLRGGSVVGTDVSP